MAEESEGSFDSQKKICKHYQNENGWIVCRSVKRPGLLYNFNTLTGESAWRDSQEISPDVAAIIDKNKVPFECHEPTDLPVERKPHHQKAQYQQRAAPAHATPKIYNKQIINNQFPAKPFAINPFGNAACAPYGLLNANNAISMGPPATHVWVAGPPPVLLGAPVTTLNQPPTNLPTIFGGLENMQVQNTSVTLSNRFQVLKQMNHEISTNSDLLNGSTGHQSFINYSHFPQRQNRNFVKKEYNRPKDLRSILRSRRRQDFQNPPNDNSETKEDLPAIITEDELKPDDNDEWLEAHTDGDGKKLNVDLDGIWVLANSSASRDCWYIVPTTRALLNNMRFITSLVISDERLRVLAPRDVVRALRCFAFSGGSRLADCASRARTFAIRLMSKIPSNVKDAANVKSCRELIGPNIHIVHLIDEKDNLSKDSTNGVQITAAELKRYLKSTTNSEQKLVSEIQKIADIKIVVPNTTANKSVRLPRLIPTPNQPTQEATERTAFKEVLISTLKTENNGSKETSIQTDLTVNTVTTPPAKRTANACVQTDLDFTFIHTEIKPKEITNSEACTENNNTTNAASRKIKLRRPQHSATASANSDEKKTFRWRKRKDTAPNVTPPQVESQRKSCSLASSPPTCTSNLLAQQNDNAMDCGHSDVSVHADIVFESSTSGVISNSIESEAMFKINKQAILSGSKVDRKEIAIYEITSDCMEDRLRLRCDEWMSRFVQIMEEALSQVLLLEPAFNDATLPPPWTIEEATECINRKFQNDSLIVNATDRLIRFLLNINFDSGSMETRIRPAEFMQMYSYGVDLVDKLKLVLKDCEDLHIASHNLSKLLSDIREPNLEESYDMDNLLCADPSDFSPIISETVTDLSGTLQDDAAPASNVSPQKEGKQIPFINSPRYSLRSSRSAEQVCQHIMSLVEKEKEKTTCSENKAYTLFATLGLQKTVSNPPRGEPQTSPLTTQDLVKKNIQDVQENDIGRVEPTIIRNFTVNPELEKRLKGMHCADIEIDKNYPNGYYSADDYGEDDYTGDGFTADEYLTDDYINFSGDKHANNEPYSNENNCNDMLERTPMNVDQTYDKTKLGDLNSSEIFKRVVQFTTHKFRRWLTDLHRFCEVTNAAIKCTNYSLPENHASLVEKTAKLSKHAKTVCHRLKCILNRDSYVTIENFRGLMKDFGIHDFDMNDVQLAEYRVLIERYLKLAEQLLTCVTRLADSAKAK